MLRPTRVSFFAFAITVAAISLSGLAARADVRLPHVISDNMVLQRDIPVPIWGWADAGEEVSVKVADHEARAKSDASGRWSVKLAAMPAGGPFEMTVSGKNSLRIANVLVGEVWVCSGQSNMTLSVANAADATKEIKEAEFPQIRLLNVPTKLAGVPLDDADIKWQPCSPKTVAGFSAVAYYYGRELHRKLGVPVGLIHTSWGGTAIEPWTPLTGFETNPQLASIKEMIDDANKTYRKLLAQHLDGIEAWLPLARKALADETTPPTFPAWPEHPLVAGGKQGPTSMFNAMIHPLIPYGMRGAIWYQGENNNLRNEGMLYHEKMKALIGGWRAVWHEGEFPFYYVQLAPWRYESRYPGPGGVTRLPATWEAQTATLSVPNTGMAVTTDIGDLKDIHPKNKQEVGRRLALWALAKTYDQRDLVCSGPLYKSMTVEGDRVRIRFEHVAGGLASRDGKPLTWFQIAGADRKFIDAKAVIDGQTVIVSSESVKEPKAVRFGWHEEAQPNLMNKEGLPASPFRTDRW